jgi:hypothetical protein
MPAVLEKLKRGIARQLRRVWRGRLRRFCLAVAGMFPFTRTGLAFLALFGGALWLYGLQARDLVLLVAGLGGLLVLLVLLGSVTLAALLTFLRSRRAATPGELDLDTGLPQPTGFRLPALRWIPFAILSWEWVDDGGGETAARVELERQGRELAEMASPVRRCIVTRIVRRFAVRDLFGWTEYSWRVAETVSLRVLPYRGRLSEMPPPAGFADGDDLADPFAAPRGDRVEMRQYAPGDPLRMVLWKVYARTGKMMVRTPERSVAERKRGCAYLVTGPADDATAAAARVAVERGLLGEDWRLAADGVDKEASDFDSAMEVIARSGEAATADQAANLGAFLTRAEAEGYQFCLLFVPPDASCWEAVAAQAAATAAMRVQILSAAVEILPEEDPRPAWRRWAEKLLLKPAATGGVTLSGVRQRAATVTGLASELIVVDRETGHAWSDLMAGGYAG